MWRRNNTIINTTHVTATTTRGSLLVYRNSYTIAQLSTSDGGVVYECRLVIQTSSRVRAHDTVRLDVTGEHILIMNLLECNNQVCIIGVTDFTLCVCI